jgi:hypothetical protein
MYKRNLPGFTAEASLYNGDVRTSYEHPFDHATQDTKDRIVPQACGPDEMVIVEYYPCFQYSNGLIGWCMKETCRPAQRIPIPRRGGPEHVA